MPKEPNQAQTIARRINRLIGVEAHFDRLVESVLEQTRASLAASNHGGDVIVDRESEAARQRLADFRSEYLESNARTLVRYVGAEYVADVAVALESDDARPLLRFFLAQNEMTSDVARETRALAQKMMDRVLYGDSRDRASMAIRAALPSEAIARPDRVRSAVVGRRRRYVLQGVGSRGQVALLVEIGAELVRRGHECHLLTNEFAGPEAVARGMRFGAITAQAELFHAQERANPENVMFPCLRAVRDYFRSHLTDGAIVVNADRRAASNLIAELHGLPTVRLYTAPARVRSYASWPYRRNLGGLFRQTFRKYKVPSLLEATAHDGRSLAVVNRRRAFVGLLPVATTAYAEPYVRGHVALFAEWFGEPAEDWPQPMDFVGFPEPAPKEPMSAELRDFLAREPRFVVFTAGSGNRADGFFQNAKDCCEALGVGGILVSRYLEAAPVTRRRRILQLQEAELGPFLGRATAIVHHGGIGTMVQAARAGVPQIIVPFTEEQGDTGERAERHGLGRVLASATVSGATLAAEIERLIVDPGVRAALREVRASMDGPDAVDRCVDVLEARTPRAAARARAPSGEARHWGDGAVPRGGRGRTSAPPQRTVMFLVWPEPGHTAAPCAIARRLQARGDRVVFACDEAHGPHLRSLGFEHVDLAGASDWGHRWSIFSQIPSRPALGEAVDRLVETLTEAIERYRPSLVMIDSLYSAFAIVMEAAGVPWAIHETDLPREFDPIVPPAEVLTDPEDGTGSSDVIRTAWLNQLMHTFWSRERARRPDAAKFSFNWSRRYYPDSLVEELERRFGKQVKFDRFIGYMPLALGPRMIFCPRDFDFRRTRSGHGSWVGPCIDHDRPEPPFPWSRLPEGLPLAYCSFGTQSLRDAQTPALIQAVVDAFAAREDFFVVLACPSEQRPKLRPEQDRVLIVEKAPQLALLRRAALAITHAGFNSVKECAAYGVPMIALPLSHDQPRNASLVQYHRLGVAFDPLSDVSAARVDHAITEVTTSLEVREACRRMRRVFEGSPGYAEALAFIDAAIVRRSTTTKRLARPRALAVRAAAGP